MISDTSETTGFSEKERNQPWSKNSPKSAKRDRPQRMGVKRSDAEGGPEMDAV